MEKWNYWCSSDNTDEVYHFCPALTEFPLDYDVDKNT